MDDRTYHRAVSKTESNDFKKIKEHLSDNTVLRLLHAAIGLTTETGEFVDAIKRHVFYGKPLKENNLVEELGDLLWYITTACNALGVDLETVKKANIDKLFIRYGNGFSNRKALKREVNAELEAIEKARGESDNVARMKAIVNRTLQQHLMKQASLDKDNV